MIAGAALAPTCLSASDRTERRRAHLVEEIRNEVRASAPAADNAALDRVLRAIGTVPRENFVAAGSRGRAYRSEPLLIGYGQTISDPFIVAIMLAAADLPSHARVLDVGTGSGYQAAVLARLADHVSSIEIVEPLGRSAATRLAAGGYDNVNVRIGDGYEGWPEQAPFDAIVVAAGAAEAPQPLLAQLRIGGRLVMPIGAGQLAEQIMVITRTGPRTYTRCTLGWTIFVPLTGRGARAHDVPGFPFDLDVSYCFGAMIARPSFVIERRIGR